MGFPRRDQVATFFVTVALVTCLSCMAFADGSGTRVIVRAVLLLGIAASVSAVVPGVDELLHGSKAYLVIASAIGPLAFVAGLVAFIGADEVMLAVLVIDHGLVGDGHWLRLRGPGRPPIPVPGLRVPTHHRTSRLVFASPPRSPTRSAGTFRAIDAHTYPVAEEDGRWVIADTDDTPGTIPVPLRLSA